MAWTIPAEPVLLPVVWKHDTDRHCLDDQQAQHWLINQGRLKMDNKVLRDQLRAMGAVPAAPPSDTPDADPAHDF